MTLQNDAINKVLRVIGEQPIDNETSYTELLEAEEAYTTINEITDEILSDGWVFNSETNRPYLPDYDGYIVIPENVLKIDPTSTADNFIRKDGKLYNKDNKDYIFTDAVACDVVLSIPFDDIPPVFQAYITAKASSEVYLRLVGDLNVYQLLTRNAQEAYLKCLLYEEEAGDYNIFDDSSVSRALTRGSNPTGIRG